MRRDPGADGAATPRDRALGSTPGSTAGGSRMQPSPPTPPSPGPEDGWAALFQSVDRAGERLTARPLTRLVVPGHDQAASCRAGPIGTRV